MATARSNPIDMSSTYYRSFTEGWPSAEERFEGEPVTPGNNEENEFHLLLKGYRYVTEGFFRLRAIRSR